MPRRFIKRYLPNHGSFREHPHLKRFGARLQDGNLWHLNRRSVSGAVAVGLFWAFMPIPLQMIPAAASAIFLRINLPISIVLVWITNPLTMPPILYGTYRFGAWLLGRPPQRFSFTFSMDNLFTMMHGIWAPLLLGSLVTGVIAALLGFTLVRLSWRVYIIRHRRARAARS